MMPDINGFEVCRKIKQNSNSQMIPVLMVTALNDQKHRLRAMESGADDFLSKPVDKTELKIRIKSLLRIKSYHDELYEKYEEISKKNDKLRKLENMKDSLIHMIVHDLKNPLFAISGNIELLLLDKVNFSKTQRISAENCLASCKDMNNMIEQLLDIHKLEKGEIPINKEKTDIQSLVHKTLDQFKTMAGEKQIQINFERDNSISDIKIDSTLIERVISNLLNNGIRHSPRGSKISIAVGSANDGNDFHFSVIDNGHGLDPAHHQRIFHKFEQVNLKKQGVSAGTAGLGLAFCKLAVEAHGGKIWVESEGTDKGATFRFTIPIS
jgi:signal transduction histidine kinase